jgi:NADH-quinone oxidoreductase subunit G
MDNPYSMNTIDICPVCALTNKDFRFKARVWERSSTESVCNGCAKGCNINIWVRNNEILRLTPRYNQDVNSYWMCDHGRLNTFKFVNGEDRINGPHIRREGQLEKVDWDEAYNEAVTRIKSFSKDEIAFLGSAYATCEDDYVLAMFAGSVVGSNHIDFISHFDPDFGDDILRKNDITPNKKGAELVGITPSKSGLNFEGIRKAIKEKKIKALVIMEDDIVTSVKDIDHIIGNLELLVALSSNFNKTTELADIVFPTATFAEKNGTFVNSDGIIQRIKPAVTTVDADRALDGFEMSRLDKFGSEFDRWAAGDKLDAKPGWKILKSLSGLLGKKMKFNLAEEIFEDMAANLKAFKGLSYDDVGNSGVKLKTEIIGDAVQT